MTKPTAKALRASLAPKKPKLTQAQKDASFLEKSLAEVEPYSPIDAKRTSKDACVAAANEAMAAVFTWHSSFVREAHYLTIEKREHKATKKALATALRDLGLARTELALHVNKP